MADHFLDATKKVELSKEFKQAIEQTWYAERLKQIPAADVVARDCYDRILAENDTMRNQLAKVGKKVGDSMDDVRPVVHGKWEIDNSYAGQGLMNLRCSVCGEFGGTWRDCTLPSMLYKFCPNCGANMRPDKNGQSKEGG